MGFLSRLRRNRSAAPVNPNTPHKFRQVDDGGFGAAVIRSAGSRTGQPLGMNASLAGTFTRQQRCGVPGCGRERDDAIHFPEG
jgi:hypothetical protein